MAYLQYYGAASMAAYRSETSVGIMNISAEETEENCFPKRWGFRSSGSSKTGATRDGAFQTPFTLFQFRRED